VRMRELEAPYRLEAAHVYELLDETYWAPNFEAFMGLVRLRAKEGGGWTLGEPKPAYYAVREMILGTKVAAPARKDCDLQESSEIQSIHVRQVTYVYCLLLWRNPRAKDLDSWVASMRSGESSVTRVLLVLLRSDEFFEVHPVFSLSARGYVNALFSLLLGREADAAGLDTYAKELKSGTMTRADVALGLVQSSEFRSRHPALFRKDAAASLMSSGG
jgi:hypothetical protein